MSRAIQLARQGLYSTHPNPRVGCVIVCNDQVVAEGFHEYPGGPHAEINALAQLQGDADSCVVYVTLEPCSHVGKTPPCVDALIAVKPRKVVIAMQDPNPLVSGQGIKQLREAGIEVVTGVLEAEARHLNPRFIKRMETNLPWIRVKMAMSLDGRTALANGLSQWITGEAARHDVQMMRAQSSAVLSTAKTVIADEAALNVRLDPQDLKQQREVRQPVRIIIDEDLMLQGDERLFSLDGEIWIFTGNSDEEKQASLKQKNVRIFYQNKDADGSLDLNKILQKLAELEINEIHTECGAGLSGALLQRKLVDEVVVFMAPCLLGDQAKGLFDLGEISIMSDRLELEIKDVRQVGNDMKLIARPL